MWGIREVLKNRKRNTEIMASLRSKAEEQEKRENAWALREQIRNETPGEKRRRKYDNMSKAQTERRTREALQMEEK
jgi:hypothetical protein